MSKKPSFQFYPGDWMKDPKLSMCQPATRGVWIDLLCAMHENEQSGEIAGSVNQLARICRCLPEEMQSALDDLSVTKTALVTECNKIVTVICRRMFEDAKERKQTRLRVQKHRNKSTDEESNEDVTPPSSTSTSTSKKKEETNVSSKKMKNGCRIPDDYFPKPETIEWALKLIPGLNIELRVKEFKNYWSAKSGKDATKIDWDKTFENRIIQIAEYQSNKEVKNGSNKTNGNGYYPKKPTNADVLDASADFYANYPS